MLLLHWGTHNEGGHIILARTERAMFETATRVFEEHPDAEIKTYSKIEIVSLPTQLCELAARYDHLEKILKFQREVVSSLREALDAGKTLPSHFKVCDAYESTTAEVMTDYDLRWASKRHFNCKNCCERIVSDLTYEQLYSKYGEQWFESCSLDRKRHSFDLRLVSSARQASNDEQLWVALANFGHHSNGIVLCEVVRDEAMSKNIVEFCRPDYLSGRVIFFYRKLSEQSQSSLEPLTKLFETSKQNSEDQKARRILALKNKRSLEKEQRINNVLNLFVESQ